MSRTIEIAISGNNSLALAPLRISQEGDDYLVGERGSRSYLVMQAAGAEVVRMLQAGSTPAQVKQALCLKYATPDITLAPLLQSLVQAGFVRAVAGRTVVAVPPSAATATRMHLRHVAWLFTAPMLALYAGLIVTGVAIAVLEPGLFPRPRDMILAQNYALTVLVTLLFSFANVAKHEAAHVIAAKYLGVEARCSLGHRLFFPVIQTDLTDLWLVDPRRRYIAYVAGMVSDLVVAALLLIVLSLAAHGSLAIGQTYANAMKLGIVIIAGGIVWQFNLFMRTDVYYIIANALRCRDLAHDAKRYLLYRVRRLAGKAALAEAPVLPEREARVVPIYAAILVLGTTAAVLTAAAYVFGVLFFVVVKGHTGISVASEVAPGPQGRFAVAGMLAITVALLGVSLVRERRRERITYRLIPMGEL